jgi:hypothetical protein
VHNVDYANALLRRSHDDMNAARASAGLSTMPLPWPEAASDSPCMRCHQGVESREGRFKGRIFPHEIHVTRAALDCGSCHRPHEERPADEVVRFGAAGCTSCHHRDASADCASCHAGVREGTVASPLGAFDHVFHLDDMGLTCGDCHQLKSGRPADLNEETCAGCHG